MKDVRYSYGEADLGVEVRLGRNDFPNGGSVYSAQLLELSLRLNLSTTHRSRIFHQRDSQGNAPPRAHMLKLARLSKTPQRSPCPSRRRRAGAPARRRSCLPFRQASAVHPPRPSSIHAAQSAEALSDVLQLEFKSSVGERPNHSDFYRSELEKKFYHNSEDSTKFCQNSYQIFRNLRI